jgi:hypothetical protein
MSTDDIHRLAEHLLREGYVADDVHAISAAAVLHDAADRFCEGENDSLEEAGEA